MLSSFKRALLGLFDIVYGVYAATAFLVCGLLAFALVVLPHMGHHERHQGDRQEDADEWKGPEDA